MEGGAQFRSITMGTRRSYRAVMKLRNASGDAMVAISDGRERQRVQGIVRVNNERHALVPDRARWSGDRELRQDTHVRYR